MINFYDAVVIRTADVALARVANKGCGWRSVAAVVGGVAFGGNNAVVEKRKCAQEETIRYLLSVARFRKQRAYRAEIAHHEERLRMIDVRRSLPCDQIFDAFVGRLANGRG